MAKKLSPVTKRNKGNTLFVLPSDDLEATPSELRERRASKSPEPFVVEKFTVRQTEFVRKVLQESSPPEWDGKSSKDIRNMLKIDTIGELAFSSSSNESWSS